MEKVGTGRMLMVALKEGCRTYVGIILEQGIGAVHWQLICRV